jgi:hypothetical protein
VPAKGHRVEQDIKASQKFGNWTVLSQALSRRRATGVSSYWNVLCVCGKQKQVRGTLLRLGQSEGCGCDRPQYLPPGESAKNALWCSYRYSAKVRGISWRLTRKDFNVLIVGDCFYCGGAPRLRGGVRYRGRKPGAMNGIDRRDSDKGYTASNCVSCCSVCNTMKMDSSQYTFLAQVEKIYNYKKEK